MYIDRN